MRNFFKIKLVRKVIINNIYYCVSRKILFISVFFKTSQSYAVISINENHYFFIYFHKVAAIECLKQLRIYRITGEKQLYLYLILIQLQIQLTDSAQLIFCR